MSSFAPATRSREKKLATVHAYLCQVPVNIVERLLLLYCCLCGAVVVGQGAGRLNETVASHLISKLLKKSDEKIRPNIFGKPVTVTCDLYVSALGPIDTLNMDYQTDIYFRQKWVDPRLAFTEQESPVIIPHNHMYNIWKPDIFFPNEKTANIHQVMVPNQVINIYPNGTVHYSSRLTLRLACPMMLTHFPMDYQQCNLKISSYSYNTDELVLKWEDDQPIERARFYLPQFALIQTIADNCSTDYKTGKYGCLMARFKLKREFGYYLLQCYIPSTLVVIISWVSFWIHKSAVPARITLGVTTVLTMATQLQSAQGQIVSYARAIDVWYAFCMILVFSTLIEYAFVNSLSRQEETLRSVAGMLKKKNKKIDYEMRELNADSPLRHDVIEVQTTNGSVTLMDKFKKNFWSSDGLDIFSRYFFPSAFVLFNLLYWVIYTQETFYIVTGLRPGETSDEYD